jgi:prevent-host-death family protein
MKVVTITEAKNKLSALLDLVRSGETILIVDRGRPVARLEPAVARDEDADGRIARLERAGAIAVPAGRPPLDVVAAKPPRAGASVVQALLRERRESR